MISLKETGAAFLQMFSRTIPDVEGVACRGINDNFAIICTTTLYKKILLESAEKAAIPNEVDHAGFALSVYDSFSPAKKGLISILVDCIVNNRRIFIEKKDMPVKNSYTFVQIDEDKAFSNKKIKASVIELDFSNFIEARLIFILFECLGLVLSALDKNITISNALIFKIKDLSAQVASKSAIDPIVEQIKSLNSGIREGKGGFMDSGSSIDTVEIKTDAASRATNLIYGLIATIVGLPKSDLFSEVTTGLGSSDRGDERRANVGYKKYFHDVLAGVFYSVWDRPFSYKIPPVDLSALIDAAAFIETTSILTREGKLNILKNHFSGLGDNDFNIPLELPSVNTIEKS